MDLFFPFHPRLVHFPIALITLSVLLVAGGLVRRDERWITWGRVNLLLGWLAAILAALAGLIDQSRAAESPVVAQAINQHITAGVGLIITGGLALYWPLRDRKLVAKPQRWAYLALLLLTLVLVWVEGWLGGKLVYTLGVGIVH